jgi:hypothetical protein
MLTSESALNIAIRPLELAMTIPYERLRSLSWGREILRKMSTDELLPNALRLRVSKVLETYPTLQDLRAAIPGASVVVLGRWADVIDEAATLLDVLRQTKEAADSTRCNLTSTLRHFPLAGEARATAMLGDSVSVTWWIDDVLCRRQITPRSDLIRRLARRFRELGNLTRTDA